MGQNQSRKTRLWVKSHWRPCRVQRYTKVRKPDYGWNMYSKSKVGKSDKNKSQSPIFPLWDFPMVGKSDCINNTYSFNNTNYLIREKKYIKYLKEKSKKKTIGSSSIITKGNSQSHNLTSLRQTFMTINTNWKPDKYQLIKAVSPIMKGFISN